jgi:hypothetical protein
MKNDDDEEEVEEKEEEEEEEEEEECLTAERCCFQFLVSSLYFQNVYL